MSFLNFLLESADIPFNIIPKKEKDIDLDDDLRGFNRPRLKELYNFLVKASGGQIIDPISLDKNRPKAVKIARSLSSNIDLEELKQQFPDFNLQFGDGSRGNRGVNSTGFSFEREVIQDLNLYALEGLEANFIHPDIIEQLHDQILKTAKKIEIIDTAAEHNKRPLNATARGIVFGDGKLHIGRKIADIIIKADNVSYFLSLKHGNSVSFFNVGIQRLFKTSQFKKQRIENPMAQRLLQILELDEKRFIDTFNNYASVDNDTSEDLIVDVTDRYRKNLELNRLLMSSIGYGYYFVHKTPKGRYKVDYVDWTYLNDATAILSAKIKYPKFGQAKRIDINILTKKFKMKLNIRSKAGTIYPTHIVGDYIFND